MRTRNEHIGSVSRRDMLRFAAGATGAALLAACGGSGATSTPAAGQATSGAGAPTVSAAGSAPAASVSPPGRANFVIPTTSANLPTEKVNLHWVDSGDQKAVFFKQFFPAYQKVHPNITVQYDGLPWNEIAKIVPLGVQNGNAPDVFQIPLGLTGGQAVAQGWVMPLDDLIPDFSQWKAGFPSGAFVKGITDFNGKSYTLPLTTNKRYDTLTLYNLDYMQRAGYDPASKPFTWDEFRAAAKKTTQQGQGKYYGLIIGGNQTGQFSSFISGLARMAGASGNTGTSATSNINYKTGEYNYLTDQYLAAIDLLRALKADGSTFPGSASLDAPQARSQFPQGVAGMILQGPWNVPQWKQANPGFKFGVASQPVPNSGTPIPLSYAPGGSNQLWVYAKTKYPQVAGDLFHYLGTLDGQTTWGTISDGADAPIFPDASKQATLDPEARAAEALFTQQLRLGPDPAVRNEDVVKVSLELKSLTPDFGTVMQGIFTGQVSDPKKAMQDLRDRSEAELGRAIKAAQAKGAKVTRDDWVFPNWDPTKDYTDADYAALKK
ncbi:MAG: ABC transporter substrate-binding protein [Thermomicrobiales bacterium]